MEVDQEMDNKQVYNKLEVINPFINKKDKLKKKNNLYAQIGGILLVFMNVIEVMFIGLNYAGNEHSIIVFTGYLHVGWQWLQLLHESINVYIGRYYNSIQLRIELLYDKYLYYH